MLVIIQFKSPERTLVRSSFEMEPDEIQRLINDFKNYKMGGNLKGGTYMYLITDGNGCKQKNLVLDFQYLAKISYQTLGATN